jgi:uncharacterized protein (TIGR03382 family)
MSNKQTTLVAASIVAALLAPASAFAADVHVHPGESISSAVNHASPGDRVLVHAGTYPGSGWIEHSGTEAAPITVLSVDGVHAAILEGGGESLRISNSGYLVFDGLEVRNSGDNAVHIDGQSHHITLRNVYAHDAGFNGDVLKVNQSNHIIVEHSEFARPGARDIPENPYQECVDFVDVDDSVIRDNYIHDGGSMLVYVKAGSRNDVMERNVVADQRPGASDPMVGLGAPSDLWALDGEQYEAINTILRNNVIIGGKTGAIAVYDADGAFIANNLLIDNDRVLVEFRAGGGPAALSRNVRVVNNIMLDTRGLMPVAYQRSSHGLEDFQTSNNLFWNAGSAVPNCPLLALDTQPGHMVADPLVTPIAATASRDAILSTVRPHAGSVATASGMNVLAAPYGVIDDILGNARGATMDRGPYVLVGGTPPPTDSDAGMTTPPPPVDTDAGSIVPPPSSGDSGVASDASTNPSSNDSGTPSTGSDAGAASHDAGGSAADSGNDATASGGGCNAAGTGSNGLAAMFAMLLLAFFARRFASTRKR